MRRSVRGEIEPPRAPMRDLRPAQVRQAIPGVADIPGVGFPHEIGDHKRRRRETEVGKDGIGVVGERGVAVVEGQEERAACGVRRLPGEFREGDRLPSRTCHCRHLPCEDGAAHPSDAQLERAADAVVAEDGGKCRQCGQSHTNTAQVTSAKITPSNVDFSVIVQDRLYQIDICQSASV